MDFTTHLEKERPSDERAIPAARYYLLDGDCCIISAQTGEENAARATSFFDLFPANRLLREEITSYIHSYPRDVLLTLCGRTPVLFIGTLYAHTGLVLAALPEAQIKKTLSFPAAFHHVPACVCVSASAQMRYLVHDEAAFADACRWLLAVSAPFLATQSAELELPAVLSTCAQRLCALLQTPLSCDFSGLPALSCAGVCPEFAVGVMLATLWAARRVSPVGEVQLYAAYEGAPMLYLSFSRADEKDPLPEFAALLRCAAARGAVLDVVCLKKDPHLVQLRAGIGVVELSAQGGRERHHFLEGKSPLVLLSGAHTLSPSFPEISFD